MNNNALMVTVAGIGALVILGTLFFLSSSDTGPMATSTATSTATTTGNGSTSTRATSTPATSTPITRVSLAMLDTAGTTAGKERGCDRVVMVPFTVATTTRPLTAAMQRLFALSTTSVNGLFNYIDRTNETLAFDRATITNGTANIYLTGNLSGLAGVCDDPRAQIQIEETVLQFPAVSRVQIYLNGTPTNLTPSQQ